MPTEKQRAYSRKYYQEHRQEISRNLKKSQLKNRIRICERARLRGLKQKEAVMSHYSGGAPICVKCGITDIDVLTIDHINGNGSSHRRAIGIEGNFFYRWLIRNNYPKGYQALCFNCNIKKHLCSLRERCNQGG